VIDMAMNCEKVQEVLERFYDKELHGEEFEAVKEHLHACEHCSSELKKLEQTGEMLRAHYAKAIVSEDLSGLWDRVDAATAQLPNEESETIREKLARLFAVPKPAWAMAALIAVAIIIALSYLPGDKVSTFAANDCIIDKVESEDYSVMVYEVGDTGMKFIWVMDQQSEAAENGKGVSTT
jgi:predicted anti-sigma-YlaC factor YlaD